MANITLKLDETLLQEARVLAAKRGTSVSRLVTEQLEELVKKDRRYDSARRRAVKRLEAAAPLEWKPPDARDELYER